MLILVHNKLTIYIITLLNKILKVLIYLDKILTIVNNK